MSMKSITRSAQDFSLIDLSVTRSVRDAERAERKIDIQGMLEEVLAEISIVNRAERIVAARTLTYAAAAEVKAVLLDKLFDFPLPEVSIVAGGGVGLDWYGANKASFTILSQGSSTVAYSLFLRGRPKSRGYADVNDPEDWIPVSYDIQRVLSLPLERGMANGRALQH